MELNDADELEELSILEAAFLEHGVCASPTSSEDLSGNELDPIELCRQLELVKQVSAAPCAVIEQVVRKSAGWADGDDPNVMRMYDDAVPCSTLLVCFGSLAQRSSGEQPGGSFEFVGAARRIGCSHALFSRDSVVTV